MLKCKGVGGQEYFYCLFNDNGIGLLLGKHGGFLSSLNQPARAFGERGGFAVALQLDSSNKGCLCFSKSNH